VEVAPSDLKSPNWRLVGSTVEFLVQGGTDANPSIIILSKGNKKKRHHECLVLKRRSRGSDKNSHPVKREGVRIISLSTGEGLT